jgi:hypothetical protein
LRANDGIACALEVARAMPATASKRAPAPGLRIIVILLTRG